RRHTRFSRDWSSDVCSSDLLRRTSSGFGRGSFVRRPEEARCHGGGRLMSPREANATQTVLDVVVQSLLAAQRTPEGVAPPAALLWTDADGQWQPLIPQLTKVLPQLLCLGSYRPQERTGPVIWLRCVVDGALPGVVPPDATPILYLPKVGRQDLRAGGDCPAALQP